MIYSLKEDIMNKCNGCGAILQTTDAAKEGYAISLSHTLCNRCFRIQNYNEYEKVEKTNEEFVPILKKINRFIKEFTVVHTLSLYGIWC